MLTYFHLYKTWGASGILQHQVKFIAFLYQTHHGCGKEYRPLFFLKYSTRSQVLPKWHSNFWNMATPNSPSTVFQVQRSRCRTAYITVGLATPSPMDLQWEMYLGNSVRNSPWKRAEPRGVEMEDGVTRQNALNHSNVVITANEFVLWELYPTFWDFVWKIQLRTLQLQASTVSIKSLACIQLFIPSSLRRQSGQHGVELPFIAIQTYNPETHERIRKAANSQ